jgi:hypothetical protein
MLWSRAVDSSGLQSRAYKIGISASSGSHCSAEANLLKTPVISMGRRNTQLGPTFIENKS